MRLSFATLCLSLAGLASDAFAQPITSGLPTGVWIGQINQTTTQADGKPAAEVFKVYVDSCDGSVRLWTEDDEKKIHPLPVATRVRSLEGTHLFYFMDAEPKQPDWEELQTFSVLELNEERAWLLWTRAVNNRDLPVGDANRFFQSISSGELKRASKQCMLNQSDGPAK